MTTGEQRTIQEMLVEYARLTGQSTGGNAQTITVTANAGVFGVWVATTACLVMLACGVLGSLWVSREFARYDAEIAKLQQNDKTQSAYIQAAYRGEHKPKEK